MVDKETAIKVDHLTKTFRIPTEASSGIKQKLINTLKGKKGYREFTPLEDISFEIKQGDFFGIVGRNGSGKSTLLKSIANIYTPTKGKVHVNGTLVPFIELGVGFNPELTGRENVFLSGALLGFSHKEMEAMYDEIVDFAEIGDFMDEKLKNYSSGMQVRLAFSIAIRAEGDILLLDEVLAVGDEAFQRKCYDYFGRLKKDKKTVILVTHDMNAAQRFCKTAMLINDGHIVNIGRSDVIANEYVRLNLSSQQNNSDKIESKLSGEGGVLLEFDTFKPTEDRVDTFKPEDTIMVRANIKVETDLVDPRVGIAIHNSSGVQVFATNTQVEDVGVPEMKTGDVIDVDFKIDNIFTDGTYYISGAVASNQDEKLYRRVENACSFVSGGWSMKHALVHPKHKISFRRK